MRGGKTHAPPSFCSHATETDPMGSNLAGGRPSAPRRDSADDLGPAAVALRAKLQIPEARDTFAVVRSQRRRVPLLPIREGIFHRDTRHLSQFVLR